MYQLIDAFRHLDNPALTIGHVHNFDKIKLNVTVYKKPLFGM